MVPITLEVPNELANRLYPVVDRLPHVLELGLRELYADTRPGFQGMAEILEFLTRLPTPDEVLALRPSAALQARVGALLEKNRTQGLAPNEEWEWQQYAYLEHLVRMAKARALLKLEN